MTTRTTTKGVTFHRPFHLKGVDRLLPPPEYSVVTDEEVIDGLSFAAYRRVSTVIFVPAESGSAVEMVTIDPLDLQAAQEQDTGALNEHTHLASVRATQGETFTMKRWDEDKPSGHSFITGSVVRLSRRYPPRKAALGPYHVVAQLPPRDGQLQYRIKSGFEPFYRTVTENELEPDIGATVTVAAS
jgi:hypothetical protein